MSLKVLEMKFELKTVFTSTVGANLIAKATVSYSDGLIIEGFYPFQVPLSASEEVFQSLVVSAKNAAIDDADSTASRLRDHLEE